MSQGPRRVVASASSVVRFPEVDAQGVVWHGNYLRYLEAARAAILELGGVRPSDFFREEVAAPIVACEVQYRAPLRLDDRYRVDAELLWEPDVPRFDFEYRVVREDGVLAATATTRQVLVDREGKLLLVLPAFLVRWQARLV